LRQPWKPRTLSPATRRRALQLKSALPWPGKGAMLSNLSEQIKDCYAHAEECARKAAAQSNPRLKQDFLDMEQRWLSLAQSYEFSERLGDFSDSRASRETR
jgi:hypothetical protein